VNTGDPIETEEATVKRSTPYPVDVKEKTPIVIKADHLCFGNHCELDAPNSATMDIREGVADYVGDVTKIPLPNESLTGVECIHVLEHLLPEAATVAVLEIKRVLKPGGVALFAVPDMEACAKTLLSGELAVLANIFSPSDKIALQHRWGYTKKTLRDLLTNAGFSKVVQLPHHPTDPHEVRMECTK
jgi:SAM-dependent methyltransferase